MEIDVHDPHVYTPVTELCIFGAYCLLCFFKKVLYWFYFYFVYKFIHIVACGHTKDAPGFYTRSSYL